MIRPSFLGLLTLAAVCVATAACSSDDATSADPPDDVSCTTSSAAGDADGARAALAGAKPGTCIVLTGPSYAGPFSVPSGASLVARKGAVVEITGGTAGDPAVTLGEGAGLHAVTVKGAGGVGVAVRAPQASLSHVTVTGAKSAAVAIACSGDACASGAVTLSSVALTDSGIGLWVSGAHVTMSGGTITNQGGTSLSGGMGLVVVGGASVEIDGAVIEKNQGTGVLIDGAKTRATLKNATIDENGERGVWIQKVEGTLDAPSVKLDGCKLSKNRIVGVGAVESRGIIIVGGRVGDTALAPVVTNLATTEQVGDGVGLFGSYDVKIEGTALEANARAAGIIDGSDRGIIIVGGSVQAGASGLKVVIQNSKTDVQIDEALKSTPEKALGVSAPQLQIPSILPQ